MRIGAWPSPRMADRWPSSSDVGDDPSMSAAERPADPPLRGEIGRSTSGKARRSASRSRRTARSSPRASATRPSSCGRSARGGGSGRSAPIRRDSRTWPSRPTARSWSRALSEHDGPAFPATSPARPRTELDPASGTSPRVRRSGGSGWGRRGRRARPSPPTARPWPSPRPAARTAIPRASSSPTRRPTGASGSGSWPRGVRSGGSAGGDAIPRGLTFTPDGTMLATGEETLQSRVDGRQLPRTTDAPPLGRRHGARDPPLGGPGHGDGRAWPSRPDGKTLAWVGGSENIIRFWDAATGREIRPQPGPPRRDRGRRLHARRPGRS